MVNENQLFSLSKRVALVTGATGFLGKEIATSLAEAGAHVIVQGRNTEKVNTLVDFLKNSNYSAEALIFDLLDQRQLKTALRTFEKRKLHVVVNNAYAGTSGTILTTKPDEYRKSFEITVIAAHNMLTHLMPAMEKARNEFEDVSIVNIASMYGLVSPDLKVYGAAAGSNPPFYGATKAALIQWTKYAACEFGPLGIRVNSISPGPFPNDAVKKSSPTFIEKISSRVPLGRVGIPEELKGPVVFLASPASSFVNGANLVVDGGWTAW